MSEAAGKFQSLKCLEVLGAKTCRPMDAEDLAGVVADVYALPEELVQEFQWKI